MAPEKPTRSSLRNRVGLVSVLHYDEEGERGKVQIQKHKWELKQADGREEVAAAAAAVAGCYLELTARCCFRWSAHCGGVTLTTWWSRVLIW